MNYLNRFEEELELAALCNEEELGAFLDEMSFDDEEDEE